MSEKGKQSVTGIFVEKKKTTYDEMEENINVNWTPKKPQNAFSDSALKPQRYLFFWCGASTW